MLPAIFGHPVTASLTRSSSLSKSTSWPNTVTELRPPHIYLWAVTVTAWCFPMGLYHNACVAVTVTVTCQCAEREGSRLSEH